MPTPVTIPKATITMEEAVVVSWRKQPGEHVEKDEILFEMETDKVVVEVPSPATGVLLRIDIHEGAVKVEQAVAWIGARGEEIPMPGRTTGLPGQITRRPDPESSVAPSSSAPAEQPAQEVAASPAARGLARELGVALKNIRGTGPGGRITEADVEEASQNS